MSRQLNCQSRLANATGAGERDQPAFTENVSYLGDFGRPTHEAVELHGKIMGSLGARRPRSREVDPQVGMAQLDHAFGPRDVPQLVAAQIGQPRSRWQVIDDELFGCGGQDGLTAVGQVAYRAARLIVGPT